MTDQLPEANPLTKAMREYADEIDGIPMSEERTKTMRVRLANVAAAFMRSAAVEIDDLRRAHLSCSTITDEQVAIVREVLAIPDCDNPSFFTWHTDKDIRDALEAAARVRGTDQ